MNTVLQISTSIHSEVGNSSRLADEFVAALRARRPGTRVIARDIASAPVPHLDAARFQALLSAPAERSLEQQAVVSYSDTLIEELQAADMIVLGLPMYNFGIPSQLKAYFDHVARAGVTFRYSEKGPVGLLTGKRAYVFATRGGYYRNTAKDTQSLYVRDFLNFIGIDDIEFVYAEGLAISDTSKQRALRAAQTAMGELLEELAQAA